MLEGKKGIFFLQILLKKQCFPLRLQCDKTTIQVIRNQVFPDKFLPVFHSAYISFQSARTRPVQIYIHSSSRWPILIQLLRSQELYKYVLSCDASAPWHAPQALFPFERNIACLSWPWICKKKKNWKRPTVNTQFKKSWQPDALGQMRENDFSVYSYEYIKPKLCSLNHFYVTLTRALGQNYCFSCPCSNWFSKDLHRWSQTWSIAEIEWINFVYLNGVKKCLVYCLELPEWEEDFWL